MNIQNKQSGFIKLFLIVLAVVILIGAIPLFLNKSQETASVSMQDAQIKSDVAKIRIELEMYRAEHKKFPNDLSFLKDVYVVPSALNNTYSEYRATKNGEGYELKWKLKSSEEIRVTTDSKMSL